MSVGRFFKPLLVHGLKNRATRLLFKPIGDALKSCNTSYLQTSSAGSLGDFRYLIGRISLPLLRDVVLDVCFSNDFSHSLFFYDAAGDPPAVLVDFHDPAHGAQEGSDALRVIVGQL